MVSQKAGGMAVPMVDKWAQLWVEPMEEKLVERTVGTKADQRVRMRVLTSVDSKEYLKVVM